MIIGLFSDTYQPDVNGVATATQTLKEQLEALGHDVFVVTTNLPGHQKVEIQGHVVRIPGKSLKRIYSYRLTGIFSRPAYEFLKDIPFDVIHVQTEYGIGQFGRLFAKMKKIPLVFTYHSLYEDFTYIIAKKNIPLNLALKKAVHVLSKEWAKQPDEFIVPSEKTLMVLRQYGIKRYISVIPNGIDLSAFKRREDSDSKAMAIRKQLGLTDKRVISVVGRIGQEKGLDFILECLRHYINETGDESIRLLVVGDGPYRAEFQKNVHALWLDSYVVFAGRVPYAEVPAYYWLSDALVSGSQSETQGLTINEAMAARCLVLVRKDPSFEGAVKEGETGFFFSDPDTFEMALTRIFGLSCLEKHAILNGAEDWNSKWYSPVNYAKEVLNVYQRAVRKTW